MTNIFGNHDDNTLEQFNDVSSRAVKSALMADGHRGYIMPIGGVAAYDDMVSIMGVGFDIACGNCAIKLDTKLDDLGKSQEKRSFMLNRIADNIQRSISFGMGRHNSANDAPTDHSLFDKTDVWNILRERAGHGNARKLYDTAKLQLGTVGGGNHYVDVFVDEEGYMWVGVHFGSRGLGHGVASGFNDVAQGKFWGDRAEEVEGLVSLKSSMGQDYWELMTLAGEYAYAGREWVARKVASIIGGQEIDMVHNHHNFAWKEPQHINGKTQNVVVVRKGATPAFPSQRGFVGGSMGDISVILEGREPTVAPTDEHFVTEFSNEINAMFSTVHGAGRVMSRSMAKGSVHYRTGAPKLDENGVQKRLPLVTEDMMNIWMKEKGVIRRGGEVDEAPHVYRRLPEVLAAQGDTIRVLHTLTPLIVCMAGSDIVDPYKD